jgi:uncharacterized DUF497 family protein
MKKFNYDLNKSEKLYTERGLSFEEIIALIESGHIIDVLEHPNQDKYHRQKIYLLDVNGYLWLVPFVETEDEIFLKTAFPSRKHNKLRK